MFTCQNRRLGRWHGLWTSSSSAEPAPTEVVPEAMPDASTVGCIRMRIMKTWIWRIETETTKTGSLGICFPNSLDLWASLCLPDLCSFAALPGHWQYQKIVKSAPGRSVRNPKGSKPNRLEAPSKSNLRLWLPLLFELFSSITCNHARLIEARF